MDEGNITTNESILEYGGERNKLVIQPTGVVVIEFLEKNFASLFSYDYTKTMEESLDEIAERKYDGEWYDAIQDYYNQLISLINTLKTQKLNKVEYTIDENHTYLIGKHGPVIKCNTDDNISFKPVKDDIDVHKIERGEYTIDEIVDDSVPDDGIIGEYKDHQVAVKKGRFGLYVTWGNENILPKPLGNRPIENITLDDVIPIIENSVNGTRDRDDRLSVQVKEVRIFFILKTMKKPKFCQRLSS